MTCQIYFGVDGRAYMRLVSANGRTILDSQGYARPWGARRRSRQLQRMFPELQLKDLTRKDYKTFGAGK